MSSPVVRVRRVVPASPERVFHAWTDPDELRAWWGPDGFTTPEAIVDLRVGGSYRLLMQPPGDAPPFALVGRYLEIEPPRRLVYTWQWAADAAGAPAPEAPTDDDLAPGETVVTVEFHAFDEQTEVFISHGPFATPEDAGPYEQGWTASLGGLADLLGQ